MKKLLLFIFTISSIQMFSQITVDESMTPQQLIESIFLNGSVVDVTNVQSQSGSDFGSTNSIAAFSNTSSDFPFSGVILTTGDVNDASGPNTDIQSNGGWPGDPDIEAITDINNSNDATFLQFDFAPYVNQLNLSFILASEEYDQNFECTFADTFAFILTDLDTGISENIALIPGTDTPIAVTNIHPEIPGQCPAENETFFGQYNFEPFSSPNDSATNFNGQTVEIMVSTELVVGHEYTIKLVVADNLDTVFDSAIFLANESFGFQLDLGMDRMASNDNAPCGNSIETIGIPSDEGTTYQWLQFNASTSTYEPISGETSSRLDITASGDYRLEVTASNNTVLMDDITVAFEGDFGLGTPNDIFIDEGDNNGLAIFDLTINNTLILNGENSADFTISYYETLQDAEDEINAIANPTAYQNIENPQTVYVRTTSLTTDCRAISSFVLETDVLSVDTENQELFSVFPNPASNNIHLQFIDQNDAIDVYIYDIQGKLVKEEKSITSQDKTINVQTLSQGLYFIQVRSGATVSVRKLIKE